MKKIGIICEYNPFHNGHIYHIKKIKEMYSECVIILVLGGNFTQRGEISLIDKWKKTDIALNYVDLVIELPFCFASQSADLFCKGSIEILKHLKVDAVVFGSEENNIDKLKKIADIQETKEYNKLVRECLDKGINYPTAMSKAVYDLTKEVIKEPNDLLGLGYVKYLKGTGIKPISIKRTNNYLDEDLIGNISSGTSIRKALQNGKDVKKYVPNVTYKYLNNVKFIDDYFELIKYRILSDDISKYQTVDEGIENRVKKYIYECNCVDELLDKLKTKRYTYNKLRRMLIHILVGFTKDEASRMKDIRYIRVLGFNKKGQRYLNEIKKEIDLPIITNFKNDEMLNLERRVSDIYNLKKKDDPLCEHKHKPIIH